MEKGTSNYILTVALTGPECTGKSTLARELAEHYNTIHIPEYARDYIGSLSRAYTYEDVEHIAETQVRQLEDGLEKANGILFLDTWLIITKVWFDLVFKNHPEWINRKILYSQVDLYLLCHNDLPWIADPVRENGGERREFLYRVYEEELHDFGCHYRVVKGTGENRLNNAIAAVDELLKPRS